MPTNWETLQQLCKELNFQEPELRKKMWGYVIDIPSKHSVFKPQLSDAIESSIEWCKNERGYHYSFN